MGLGSLSLLTRMSACMYVYVHVCVCTYMYVCVYPIYTCVMCHEAFLYTLFAREERILAVIL